MCRSRSLIVGCRCDRDELERRFALRGGALQPHLHVRKGRDVFCNGIIQRKFAGIDQHHRRDARDRLGHGMKGKDRVRRHGEIGLDVAHTKGLQVNGAAMLLDQDDGARQPSRCNLVVEEVGQALELFRWHIRFSPAGCCADAP